MLWGNKMYNELSELITYLRLSSYRDGDYILLEEYDELMDIIKRNKMAQYLEEVRNNYLNNSISEEEYNQACTDCINELKLKKNG